MIKLEFTEEEQPSLHYERYHHPHPRVQRQMEALWLKSQGVAHREISRLTGISSTTLTRYLRAYQDGRLPVSGQLGDDAKPYQVREVRKKIQESQ